MHVYGRVCPFWEREVPAMASLDGRIVESADYGQHIDLTCENHPHLRWSTKNIAPIGCRTIFYDLYGMSVHPECTCSASFLRPVRETDPAAE